MQTIETIEREREADRRERQMAGTRFDTMLDAQAGVQAHALLRGEADPGHKRWEQLKNELYVGFKNVVCYAQIPPKEDN